MDIKRARRLPALDGLRGLAALHVVLGHFASLYGVRYHPVIALALAPVRHGLSCYPLFFVLSGFGLARAKSGKDARSNANGTKSFWMSRMQRFALPYYGALAICLLVPSVGGVIRPSEFGASKFSLWPVATHALFLHGLWTDTIYAINPPLWSMSLTFQFYLIFPLLYFAMKRMDYRRSLALMVVLWLALCAAIVYAPLVESTQFDGFILSRLLPFVTGMALACWESEVHDGETGHRRLFALAPMSIALVVAAAFLQSWRGRGGWMVDLLYSTGYSTLIAAVILSALRDGYLSRALSSRNLVWLGSLSYAIYLIHDPVLFRLTGTYRVAIHQPGFLSDLALLVVGVTSVVAFGWLFHQLFERKVSFRRGDVHSLRC